MDECREGEAALPGTLPTAPAGRPGLLRPEAARGKGRAGRAGRVGTGSRASATGITGFTARGCSSGRSTRSWRAGEPDFPFCLAWANESWSRSWLGDTREILIEQHYSEADDRAHARGWPRRSPIRATSGSTGGRCSSSTSRLALPDSRSHDRHLPGRVPTAGAPRALSRRHRCPLSPDRHARTSAST